LRVLDASNVAQGSLRELGFFDIYPADDGPAYNGAWTSYPFFASGAVIVNGIEQGLFVVRPRALPRVLVSPLSVTLAGPAVGSPLDTAWTFVVRVANDGPGVLSDTRVMETPPASTKLISVRSSQGECSMGTVVSCDLGTLARGSEAFALVTVLGGVEGDLVSTTIVSARAADGSRMERSALTTTRSRRSASELTLRRPDAATIFRIGRNNTIQWTLRGTAGSVSVDLSRDDGATWTRLSENAENVGFFDWTGIGTNTSSARIRVSSVSNPQLTQTSPAFSIVAR
jgi:hypothetical protein